MKVEIQGKKLDMMDVIAPEQIQIVIRDDGKTVWVNCGTHCLFRACQIGNLIVDDQRLKEGK